MGNNFLFNNTLQCFGDAAKQGALLPMVGCVLGAIVPAAHADTMNAPASQVATVDSSVALREEMLKIIPPDAISDYQKLSSENKATLTSFYQGLKEKNAVSTGLYAMICLLSAMQNNDIAVKAMMQPSQQTGLGLDPVSRSIRTLTKIFPETDNSSYSTAFKQYREEAEKTYAQGTELQAALDKHEPAKVKAAREKLEATLKILEESKIRLAASQQRAAAAKNDAENTGVTRQQTAQARQQTAQVRRMFGQ